ncbi:MAG: TRAP transporter large permease subunit, partial [Spirochaetales bacterium]|nr:TRAP transporter large permease subunit [Spirochaetales bacterium]
LVVGLSAGYAALFSIATMLGIGIVKSLVLTHRFPWDELKKVCINTARTAIPVSVACASAGIVIGIVSMTGIGVRFAQIVVELSGGHLFPMLLMIMFACIVLGMGLPSTAAYVVAAAVGAPALLNAGVSSLGANLFVFYFAIISFITPPVALASYAAAGLAGSNATKTGYLAFKLGIAGFIIPYLYLYHPGLLILGTSAGETLYALGLSVSAVALIALALEGWAGVLLQGVERIIAVTAAALLVMTNVWLNSAGALAGLMLVIRLSQRYMKTRSQDPI